jgi:hypothetical protein
MPAAVSATATPKEPPVAPPVAPPATPATAHITIHTQPAEAELLLDDAPVPNPFSGSFPKSDLRHRLVVKAPGHRSEAEWLVFDGDHTLDIQLARGAGALDVEGHKRAAAFPTTPPVHAGTPTHSAHSSDPKPVYRGTKGKLITEFPEN